MKDSGKISTVIICRGWNMGMECRRIHDEESQWDVSLLVSGYRREVPTLKVDYNELGNGDAAGRIRGYHDTRIPFWQ
jgi:hypothetical protein